LLAPSTPSYNSDVPSPKPRRPAPASRSATASHRPSAGRAAGKDAPDNVTRVYTELRSLIISGQLPPGARIAERAVVARMGLSRTPIRSALHRLQQEGLVASVGRAGDQRLIVTPLTRGDGREVFLIVGHLEGLAASEAASLPTEQRKQLVARLREVNRALGVAAKAKASPARLFDLDLQFHATYVEGVAGPRVVALHRAIKPQSERYARLYVNVLLDELPTSVKEHETIASAIAKGDRRAAQHAVETNWQNAAVRLSNVIAEHGERGSWHLWDAGADGNGAGPSERRS
jgi:DNA-binding GntR family transcriptional regulator